MFFDSWFGLGRVLIVGVLGYVALLALLRTSGKRTLSKMNAFDFVVTIALGSTLASMLLSKDVPLAEGVLALALLVLLQFVITWSSVRWRSVGRLVKSEPTLLFYEGHFLPDAMRNERVARVEIDAAVRQNGYGGVDEVRAVVLETDGSMSVVTKGDVSAAPSLDPLASDRATRKA